jgi:hypothetical protein
MELQATANRPTRQKPAVCTVINLRGTSGAGKSTVVHRLLSKWPSEVVETIGPRGKPLVYRVTIPGRRPLFVFGSYKNQCGGCDTISNIAEVLPQLLRRYAPQGDILYEGLLLSGMYGVVGAELAALEREGKVRVVFATLDTPLDVCLERVHQRRAARGNTKPLNPSNTEAKYRAVWSSHRSIEQRGHTCVVIDHRRAFTQVMSLLGVRAN